MTTFKEAKLIVPRAASNRARLPGLHSTVEYHLIEQFGGFTKQHVVGSWRNDDGVRVDDENVVYVVAMLDTYAARAKLRKLAEHVANMAQQDCVYVRHAAGDVEIVCSTSDEVTS